MTDASADDRKRALDVAAQCARELAIAKDTGAFDTKPFVDSALLIITALTEYAAKGQSLADAVRVIAGPTFAEIRETVKLRDWPRITDG